MTENPQVEHNAVNQILDRGVPLKMRAPWLFRLLGKKTITLKITSPYEGTLHRIAAYYLRTGISLDQIENLSHEEALGIMLKHGKDISKAVAVAVLNGYWSGLLFTKVLAHYIKWHCTNSEVLDIATILLIYGGTSDFISITRSVRAMKISAPRLGQEDQGS